MDRRAFVGTLAGGFLAVAGAAKAGAGATTARKGNHTPHPRATPPTRMPFAKGCATSVTSRDATS